MATTRCYFWFGIEVIAPMFGLAAASYSPRHHCLALCRGMDSSLTSRSSSMPSPRQSLKSPRSLAFSRQSGHCHYCGQPMWQENPKAFARQYRLSAKQARLLMCTGEHLVPHKDGGNATEQNIVAACLFCNKKRHQRTRDLSPEEFLSKVQKRMARGKWHPARTGCHVKRLTH